MEGDATEEDIRQEITSLELKLAYAKTRLSHRPAKQPVTISSNPKNDLSLHLLAPTHSLLLLSDSALPLGSFAYSSGLESYVAHHKPLPKPLTAVSSFHCFLELSITSVASTALPYLLSAYRSPTDLRRLDNDLDASTPCPVARRASIAQGLALLGVWERAFRTTAQINSKSAERTCLELFTNALKDGSSCSLPVNGHFAPLWAVVTLSMGLPARQSAYVFIINHAKAVLSAAVRASVMGPYQAQTVLASQWLQELATECVEAEWDTDPEHAGQMVPALDLWMGRHELLYSRIFNS